MYSKLIMALIILATIIFQIVQHYYNSLYFTIPLFILFVVLIALDFRPHHSVAGVLGI